MKILPAVQDLERAARSTTWMPGTSPGMTDRATLTADLAVTDAAPSERRALQHLAPKALKRLIRRFELTAKLWRSGPAAIHARRRRSRKPAGITGMLRPANFCRIKPYAPFVCVAIDVQFWQEGARSDPTAQK
jgi:hypothetical protein